MGYWLNLTLFKMGFWITWALIPIVVEIIPAFVSGIRLLIKTFHRKRPTMPAKMPFISLMVPVYNSEETLFNCIQSIHDSTYPTELVQVILADNQSTDDSFGAFVKAQNKFADMNMQLIHTQRGKASALNTAIYESIGTYIINIDSDGVLGKNALMNMVLQFENDYKVAALTGTILPAKKMIRQKKPWHLKILQYNEYFEYAQAFLSGRTIEARNNQLFTMSGAFSAFRKEALLNTFMYNVDTLGEDTDMTFQIRDKLKRKVAICTSAIFYIEPIPSLDNLYTQRQRWQRGEIEVMHQHTKNISVRNFFNDFLIRRMMIDHTFLFPKMIWLFASIALLFFRYSALMMGMSYVAIYLLYILVSLLNYICVRLLLRDFPDENKFYAHQWWVAFSQPIYNFICSCIRLVGTINGMTEIAAWNSEKFDQEAKGVGSIIRSDFKNLKKRKKE